MAQAAAESVRRDTLSADAALNKLVASICEVG
jgi:hypothetical protein